MACLITWTILFQNTIFWISVNVPLTKKNQKWQKKKNPAKINTTHTVILGNISSNLQNSRDIKKHIYKILDSNIKIRYTYRLLKGGLVTDAQSQRDIDIISEKSQQIFPGCILNRPGDNNQSITVVKNINLQNFQWGHWRRN